MLTFDALLPLLFTLLLQTSADISALSALHPFNALSLSDTAGNVPVTQNALNIFTVLTCRTLSQTHSCSGSFLDITHQMPFYGCHFCSLGLYAEPYLVGIASSFTLASCLCPWIDTLQAARWHLSCRSALSLLPGNMKDKFSSVNRIALLLEESAHWCHEEQEKVKRTFLLKQCAWLLYPCQISL